MKQAVKNKLIQKEDRKKLVGEIREHRSSGKNLSQKSIKNVCRVMFDQKDEPFTQTTTQTKTRTQSQILSDKITIKSIKLQNLQENSKSRFKAK
jgi:hypothetical protein